MIFKPRFLYAVIGIAVLTASVISYTTNHPTQPKDTLMVAFLDVGQGDAIYVRAPNGNDLLIDGGPDDSVLQRLSAVMPLTDRDIDIMLATHPDKDHIAGLIPVFEAYDVHTLIYTEVRSNTSFDNAFHESADREFGLEQIAARTGQVFILDETKNITLEILYPNRDTSNAKETNESSIVSKLTYGSTSFLLTGDSGTPTEQFLVAHESEKLPSTLLKLGHHGSKTSSSEPFLKAVHPELAIVSAGKDNSYHHPHPSVVDRVKNLGIELLSTIEKGTIVVLSDGASLSIR